MANTNEVAASKIHKIFLGIKNRIKDPTPAFKLISVFYHNATVQQFKYGGGLYGRSKWSPIDPKMYERHPRKDGRGMTLPKKRPGTDGSKTRVYEPTSQPLQASRGYMMSFKQQELTKSKLVFGSKLTGKGDSDLATHIQYAGGKERMVLPIWTHTSTQSRIKEILKNFAGWIAKGGNA